MNKNKLSFKVLLDNFNPSSFTGTQFNANYYVDFKTLVDNEDLDKSYYVYVNFRSLAQYYTYTEITNDNLYLLHIDFNKGPNTIQYTTPSRPMKNISYILPVEDLLEKGTAPAGGTAVHTRFNLKDNQQKPIVVKNIRSINTINLQVIKANTYTIFTPITGNLQYSKYTCILTFVEM